MNNEDNIYVEEYIIIDYKDDITDRIINNFLDDPDKYKPNNFFECFDEETSINNTIACNNLNGQPELTTSYVFDNEDLKKDEMFPFDDDIYDAEKMDRRKPKHIVSRFGIIMASAAMLFGGSWS